MKMRAVRNAIVFFAISAFTIGSVGIYNYHGEHIYNSAIETANKCQSYYEKNGKMPNLLLDDGMKMFYNSDYVLIVDDKDGNKASVVKAYKKDAAGDEKSVFSFMDLFDETKDIENVVFVDYDGNKKELKR